MEKAEIEELDMIIDEFRIKCSESIKSGAKEAYNALKNLRLKIEEANNSSDQNTSKFRQVVERMAPSINNKVKELVEKLEDVPYAK